MPGLYLPPQLQSRLLEYVRSVVREDGNFQFIIVTSSSALIDKATAEELFILMPSQQLAEGSNINSRIYYIIASYETDIYG